MYNRIEKETIIAQQAKNWDEQKMRNMFRLVDINREEFNLFDVDQKDLEFVFGIQQIVEEWEKELAELV